MSGDKPPLLYIPSWRVRQLNLLLVVSMVGLFVVTSLLYFIL